MLKKYKWVIFVVLAIALIGGVVTFVCLRNRVPDAMFYEVKCLQPDDNFYYSLIVDDKKSAIEFKREMSDTAKCETITFDRATDNTLFVYATMTVLKDVIFAFKEQAIGKSQYQVQYFNVDDEVVALSCQYSNARYNCFNEMPLDPKCPMTERGAQQQLMKICDYQGTNGLI